jgi:hypothetical protein
MMMSAMRVQIEAAHPALFRDTLSDVAEDPWPGLFAQSGTY